jgi:hypothetical protein
MLPVLILVAACAGDTTEPEVPALPNTPSAPAAPNGFRVLPGTVIIETEQQIRFRGELRTVRGHISSPRLSWEASGGTIDSLGNFSATAPGTYRIVGRRFAHGRVASYRPDTSVVVVIRRVPGVTRVRVTPRQPTVVAGETIGFTAEGRIPGGEKVPIGVTWTATGGTIDPAGVYRAGHLPGSYQVIAENVAGNLADTVRVQVTAPTLPDTTLEQPVPTPGPEPTPEPEPEPSQPVVRVVLRPSTVLHATNATHQYAAFGRTSVGDSVSVAVVFQATGGSITQGGLYTAGQTAGTYRVTAASGGLADTTVVTLSATSGGGTAPPTSTTGTGIPFGPSGGMLSLTTDVAPFTLAIQGVTPSNIQSYLSKARVAKASLLLNMTGGHHDKYLTGGKFDYSKWVAAMDAYNSPTIRQVIAEAVADGTIVGASVMDEPHVSGGGDGNTWGPEGTMTKTVVDRMCGYAKSLFPTLPVGVAHRHDAFEPEKSYRVCEFFISQYSSRHGSVTAFRDAALALAKRDGHTVVFGINILNGGTQDRDGTWDCAGTGGKGTYAPNCRMTPQQIRDYGMALGPAGCGLTMWRYDGSFMANPDNRRAFDEVAGRLATAPGKACRR